MDRIALVLAGGSGERFWPLSRLRRPKQLLKLTHPELNMLEEAVERIIPVVGHENIFIATSNTLHEAISSHGVIDELRVFAEPCKRNTLGALAWATAQLMYLYPTRWTTICLAVVTADHKIASKLLFQDTISSALAVAERTRGLVTIGIRPTRPEPGFGYLEAADAVELEGNLAYKIRSFREKPSRATAEEYLRSTRFLWNSGMFFWRLQTFMEELHAVRPDISDLITEMAIALTAGDKLTAANLFQLLPDESVDYALMEKSKNVLMVEGAFGWDDVGAWDAIARSIDSDSAGNSVSGKVVSVDTTNSIIVNDSTRMIACVLGMDNVVIVTTHDAVLVCPKDKAQDIKKVVEILKSQGHDVL